MSLDHGTAPKDQTAAQALTERYTEYDIELALDEDWLVLERGHLHADSAQASADDYRRIEFPDKTIRVVRKTVTREVL